MSNVNFRFDAAQAKAAGRRGAERGLGMAMEHLLGESRKVVPLEEGVLSRSGTAITDGFEGAVYYDTVYARRQHEELTWRHDPGRTAKYLERPAQEESDTMVKLIGAQVRRALR